MVFVLGRSAGAVDLRYWRDHLLWELLCVGPPLFGSPYDRIAKFPAQIRKILLTGVKTDRTGSYIPVEIECERVLGLRNLRSLDAFVALLFLARENELIREGAPNFLPASCALDILPHVLYRHPQLRHQWEKLFVCIERILSRRLRGDTGFEYPQERIESALAALDSNPRAPLEPISGQRRISTSAVHEADIPISKHFSIP